MGHRHMRPETADVLVAEDVSTPAGRAVAAIMATLAELELELGRERRAASREFGRARRLPVTKPLKLSPDRQEQLRRLAATGEPVRELAAAFRIGRATAYRCLAGISHRFTKAGPGRSLTTCRDDPPPSGCHWVGRFGQSVM